MCELIAISIYFPLSRIIKGIEKIGVNVSNLPLSFYRNKSYYTMRTDALDRFGTRIEKRFSKLQIKEMLIKSGFENILFSEEEPYWCVLGFKKDRSKS